MLLQVAIGRCALQFETARSNLLLPAAISNTNFEVCGQLSAKNSANLHRRIAPCHPDIDGNQYLLRVCKPPAQGIGRTHHANE
ncbi:MAG: hypothetical protein IPG93_22850 [Burkholderiales bacterium]|nr:hypothetical protein [Burkholderiales bacterium]